MRRPLGSFETALTLSGDHAPFVVVLVLELDGGPSPERLRRALDELQRRHPALGLRIVERAGRLVFEPDGTPPIPLEVRRRSAEDDWLEVAEAELGRPVDRTRGPLLRCLYLAGEAASERGRGAIGGRSELVLTVHHAILDGASATALVADLLESCGDGAEPGPEAAPGGERAALPAVEDLFPRQARGARGAAGRAVFLARQLGDELAFRLSTRGTRTPAIVLPARCRLRSLDLSRGDTSALVRRSRRERTTLTAALHAALLLAVHRHLYGSRPVSLRYLAFADLRPRLDPPQDAASLGACIAMLRYTIRLEGGSGGGALWPLARKVGRQLDAGVRRGDRFAATAFAAPLMRRVVTGRMGRMGATALSYLGPVRLAAPIPAGRPATPIRVCGLRSFVSNLPEGPQLTAQARLFDGELQLDVVYLEADLDAALAGEIAAEVLGSLRAAAEAAGR